jgi:hypothetical protein
MEDIMKTKCLYLAAITLLFMVAGCNKDAFIDEETDVNLKSAEMKMLPISWDLNVVLTKFAFPNGRPTPTGGPVEGDISHLGILRGESYWNADSYQRNDDKSPSTVDYVITGKLVADNGDELNFTTVGYITHLGPVEGTWNGKMYFSGGTGRFKKAVGEGVSDGWLTRDEKGIPHSVAMHLEGVLSSVGSSKK